MIVLKNTQLTKDALYAHDDVIEKIDFDRMERVLHLTVSAWPEYLNYDIFFHGVVGFWMTSCEAWGPDDRIYDIRIENKKDSFRRFSPGAARSAGDFLSKTRCSPRRREIVRFC